MPRRHLAAFAAMALLWAGAAHTECPGVPSASTGDDWIDAETWRQIRCLEDEVREGEREGWLSQAAAADLRETLDEARYRSAYGRAGPGAMRLQDAALQLREARLAHDRKRTPRRGP